MIDNKRWYASKGVWGGLVALGSGLAALVWGVDIGADTQAQLVSAITAILGAAGGLVGIWGRIVAKDRIGPRS